MSPTWQKIVNYLQKTRSPHLATSKYCKKIEDHYTIGGKDKLHQGTYIHPDLIHFIASEHSMEYAFEVNEILIPKL
jgi:hypothetical protein